MALGLKYNTAKEPNKINDVAVQFLDEFTKIHGSTICRELINHDLITAEDLKQAFETGAFKNCTKYVEDAAVIMDSLL